MSAKKRLADLDWRLAVGFLCALLILMAAFWPEREARTARHVAGWLGTAALGLAWWLLARALGGLAREGRLTDAKLAAVFALFTALALAVPAFHSSDVHAYVNVGQVQHAYGGNPYVTVPADIAEHRETADPMFTSTWAETPCTYGFGFALACRMVVASSGDSRTRAVFLFKLLGALGLAACAWLTLSTARRLGIDDDAGIAALLLWSPWALLHFVSNAHNDMWMGFFLVLAARALLDKRWWLVVPALVAGALIKHLALVALPFFLLAILRRGGWRPALVSTGLGLALGVLASLDYVLFVQLERVRVDEILAILTAPWNSLSAAVLYTWAHTVGSEGDLVSLAFRMAVGCAFLAFAIWRFGSRVPAEAYDARTAIADAATTLFVLLCLASAAWHPWYPGMVLGLVLLLPVERRVRRMLVMVTVFQLLAFTPLAKARVLEALVMLALPMALVWSRDRQGPDVRADPTGPQGA